MTPEQLSRQIFLRRQAISLLEFELGCEIRKHRNAIWELRVLSLLSRLRSLIKHALMSAHAHGLIKDHFVKRLFEMLDLREA